MSGPFSSLIVATYEVKDHEGIWDRTVPALFMTGVAEPIWVAPADTYWDEYGDGGHSAAEVVADHLRAKLA